MGIFDEKFAEHERLMRAVIASNLMPGEELVGVCQATEKSSFSYKGWVIGVTPQRLVMVPVDRKMQPRDAVQAFVRTDIVRSSLDGLGGGAKHFLTSDLGDIRFDVASRSFKLMALGGGIDTRLAGEAQTQGKMAFLEFLASAGHG